MSLSVMLPSLSFWPSSDRFNQAWRPASPFGCWAAARRSAIHCDFPHRNVIVPFHNDICRYIPELRSAELYTGWHTTILSEHTECHSSQCDCD